MSLGVFQHNRIVKLSLKDVGLIGQKIMPDIGIGMAVTSAVLQFAVIIPATGRAARSDIIMNVGQIGDLLWGLAGFIVLAWTGAATEELIFRGYFLNLVTGQLRGTTIAVAIAAIVTIILFAGMHGYQGWAGIIDSGLYGGQALTLIYLKRRILYQMGGCNAHEKPDCSIHRFCRARTDGGVNPRRTSNGATGAAREEHVAEPQLHPAPYK